MRQNRNNISKNNSQSISILKECRNGLLHFGLQLCIGVFLFTACSGSNPESEPYEITINSVGYHPDYPKLAVVNYGVDPGEIFRLLDAETLQPIYESTVEEAVVRDRASGDYVHKLDFSNFNQAGNYYLSMPGKEYSSGPFRINHAVYNHAAIVAMESFYYQRCGTRVDNGTSWTHPVCHIDDALFYDNPENSIDASGGWHDAGDYAKFNVTTAVSAAFLLYLYEHKPDHFIDGQLNIPENGNGIPDLLDEVRWGLEWMLKMQNEEGGVYFKVSEKRWSGEYLPHQDPDTRYIFEVSSTATADVAAVSALASRLYKNYDSEFSEALKVAAEDAWSFLEEHPEIVPKGGFTNPPDVIGGEYRDIRDLDERLWAAVELYKLTGSDKYHNWFLKHYRQAGTNTQPVSWQNVAGFALYSYMLMPRSLQNHEVRQQILNGVISSADRITRRVENSEYRIALSAEEFYWGSNSVVLGYAFDLVQAYEITGMEMYKMAALDQLHYILGRNPFGLSYVTGVGFQAVHHPYHQFSIKLNGAGPVPGMVVGGPNSANQLNNIELSEYPLKAYEDSEKNYMVNETAINYTAPFIYLAGYFSNFKVNPVTDLYSKN